jgi:aspartate kinase
VGYEDVLLVVSAMGNYYIRTCHKKNYFDKSTELNSSVQEVKYHNQILTDLFEEKKQVFAAVNAQFSDLEYFLAHNKSPNYLFLRPDCKLW